MATQLRLMNSCQTFMGNQELIIKKNGSTLMKESFRQSDRYRRIRAQSHLRGRHLTLNKASPFFIESPTAW